MGVMQTILVVDDEHDIVLALELIFRDEGFEVATASNGREALVSVAQKRPDLIVIDSMMPLMSGVEVIEKLRGDPVTSTIPIVLMSVIRPPAVAGKAKWDAFVAKPFELDRIVATVRRLLGS